MSFNPFLFKDGAAFLQKMGFTIEEGLAFLDNELEKREGNIYDKRTF